MNNKQEAPFIIKLNPEQLEAAIHTEGPLLVLAGAGTGKTRVLTSRIANMLVNGVFPSQILAVTFTNKAAREMGERIHKITNGRSDGLWLGTFHSVAAKILRKHAKLVGLESNFTIIDQNDQIRLIKQIFTDWNIDEKRWDPKIMLSVINKWKDRALVPQKLSFEDSVDFVGGKAIDVYKEYQHRLQKLNAADFGDLLLHNLTIFNTEADILSDYHRQFRYILVDEYQDTNVAQYLWLRILAQKHKNICCVGDDDQSIYGWRGAEVGNILRFEKDFSGAKVVRLEQNYRSTSNILAAASGVIAKNSDRLGKTLWTDGDAGEPVKLMSVWDDNEEAKKIADEIESLQQLQRHKLNDIAILVRASFQTRSFEECFISRGIPYRVIGGLRFYERMEIKDIISYIRVIAQNDDDLALERIINTPKRGIGDSTIQQIRQTARELDISMLKTIRQMLSNGIFKAKMATTMAELVANFDKWNSLMNEMSVPEFAETILKQSGYLDMWKNDKNLESQGRVDNLKELIHALEEFENIGEFLEHVSLVSDIDNADQENMVNIMTLHSAKGLEFETVFLPGWEDGLFPHQRAIDEKGKSGLEEERRLAYVGITRAKQRAYISYAANRRIYGQYQSSLPSRFIEELPAENIEKINLNNGFNINIFGNSNNLNKNISNSQQPPVIKKKSDAGFSTGERIFHIKFGYGKITNITGDQLDILFEKAGNKKVIDRYVEKV